MATDEELVTSALALLGSSEFSDSEIERRAAKFPGALGRLRDDPAETARIDELLQEMDVKNLLMELTEWDQPEMAAEAGDTVAAGDTASASREFATKAGAHWRPGATASAEGIRTSASQLVPEAVSTVAMDSEIYSLCVHEFPFLMRFAMHCGASLIIAQAAAEHAVAEAVRAVEQGTWARIPNQRAWLRVMAYRYCLLPGLQSTPAASGADRREKTQPRDGSRDLTSQTLRVLEAIQALPSDQRVTLAFQLDSFPVPVIAVHLSLTEQKVRDLLKDARRALSRRLAGMITSEEATRDRKKY
jgi:DNA-directed RNA polymerase specialized sigma24 family protein